MSEMAELGKYCNLKINRFVDFGAYVDGGELGEILVPEKYLNEDVEEDDEVMVFVHLDGQERYVATTEDVLAEVGEIAFMEIVDVTEHGAFADWGLVKHLFIPFREQKYKVQKGDWVHVYVFVDELTMRITGTTKIERNIKIDEHSYREGERVQVSIYRESPMGYLCVIEKKDLGLLYKNEIFQDIKIGEDHFAYVKKLREDNKIDLTLNEPGYQHVTDFSDVLWEYIKEHKSSTLHDKSSPQEINRAFGVSKKVFKKALGKLYKDKKVELIKGGFKIVEDQ